MKIFTIIGARPQFIKASVVSRAIAQEPGLHEVIVHTGQHFDANMSDVFFNQLGIPAADYQLHISGGTHGDMTGRMLIEIEKVLLQKKPDVVLVYGDTNSTLAGALAASKLHIPVAHVEAGLRSYNRRMPEEINRVMTDHLSELLLCPTDAGVRNLAREGLAAPEARVINVGDVMFDSARFFAQAAAAPVGIQDSGQRDLSYLWSDESLAVGGDGGKFILATLHRAENTDDQRRLRALVQGLNTVHRQIAPVIMPVHPRTKAALDRAGLELSVHTIEPVGYMEMLWLLQRCGLVITDSGGLQKEAFFFDRYCVTMRDQTEWVELVDLGANVLVGADETALVQHSGKMFGQMVEVDAKPYGHGDTAQKIAGILARGEFA